MLDYKRVGNLENIIMSKKRLTITSEENNILSKLMQNHQNPEDIARIYNLIETTKYEKYKSKRGCKPSYSYITYGMPYFDKSLLVPKSQPLLVRGNKPVGCFWGSPISAKFGWKEWCEAEEFYKSDFSLYIVWKLKPDARILKIKSEKDIESLPVVIDYCLEFMPNIDYNLLRNKFDAVELLNPSLGKGLYNSEKARGFSTWDCQSIVVLNPDKIEVIKCKSKRGKLTVKRKL